MNTIKEIFENFAPEYIDRFATNMPGQHRKVIDAILNCRSGHYGASIYTCQDCGQSHIIYRSCGNRHCSNCQHHKTAQWLNRQLQRQLPGHHFMITFTIPEQLRRFFRSHQRICYSALFSASADTIKKLAKDPKHIGGNLPGFFGVLHTWGRQLQYHPHIHYVVAGGALSNADDKWHPSRLDFFLPVKAMSKVFKAKLYDIMKKNNLYPDIPQDTWQQDFVVNCQSVGNPHQSLQYLSRYVFKVAISDYRIVNVQNRKVLFKYKKSGSHRWRTISLEVMEFIRRFLQHVLPTGFMKVRYYGFLNPNCSVAFEKVSALIQLAFGFLLKEPDCQVQPAKPPTCPACGGNLLYRASILPHRMQFIGAG